MGCHIWQGGEILKQTKPFLSRPLALFLSLCLVLGAWSLPARATSGPGEEACVQTLAAQLQPGDKVVPLGKAVGIKLFSQGVLVVGFSSIQTSTGTREPGKDSGLKTGDLITQINGQEVNTIEAVQAMVNRTQDQPLSLAVTREGKALSLTAQPVQSDTGSYQLGVWLRDSMAGIGTLTFYDPDSGVFAALGHGINDTDTAMLMPLESGSIMNASVSGVKKGASGDPGCLQGTFDLQQDLGTLYANTQQGIFGQVDAGTFSLSGQAVEVASRQQVHSGKAVILSNIAGDQVEEYDIEILTVYPESAGETRNLMLRVTDQRLLDATGGIVQGMSGSPILQDGRLVGAVTHVLIDDPQRGYGILAENMVSCANSALAAA